jgi:hypothetical protein
MRRSGKSQLVVPVAHRDEMCAGIGAGDAIPVPATGMAVHGDCRKALKVDLLNKRLALLLAWRLLNSSARLTKGNQ